MGEASWRQRTGRMATCSSGRAESNGRLGLVASSPAAAQHDRRQAADSGSRPTAGRLLNLGEVLYFSILHSH
jgi:hypothetical protein